jgi:hypothetical protein
MLAMPMSIALGEVGGPPPDPAAPGLFALADRPRLEQVLVTAGFEDVKVTPFNFAFRFPSAAVYAEFMREIAPPISQLIAERVPGKADSVWQKVEASSSPADDRRSGRRRRRSSGTRSAARAHAAMTTLPRA